MSMRERMRPDLKAAWVAALRSGEYTQGRGKLVDDSMFGPRHCCLGVLQCVAAEFGYKLDSHRNINGVLSEAACEQIGLPFDGATYDDFSQRTLASYNDSGGTFEEIATIIEETA